MMHQLSRTVRELPNTIWLTEWILEVDVCKFISMIQSLKFRNGKI